MKWICIFKNIDKAEELIPSFSSKLLKIGDRRICLTNINGNFRAIEDRCPHQGASLSQGKVNYLGEVICPLHEYLFSSKTGREANMKCKDASVYQTKVVEGRLYVYI